MRRTKKIFMQPITDIEQKKTKATTRHSIHSKKEKEILNRRQLNNKLAKYITQKDDTACPPANSNQRNVHSIIVIVTSTNSQGNNSTAQTRYCTQIIRTDHEIYIRIQTSQ